MVTHSEIIDIVELIYFFPALICGVIICFKHGFAREAGWFFLILLGLTRTLGGAMGIAATKTNNESVYIGSIVLDRIGAGFIIAAFSALTSRVDAGSKQAPIPPKIKKYLQLMAVAYIVLVSVGASEGNRALSQAGYVLLAVQFAVSTFILACSALHPNTVRVGDKLIMTVCLVAFPFVLVRLIYALCGVFAPVNSAAFSPISTTTLALILRGVLGVAMEIIASSLYILAGFMSSKPEQEVNRSEATVLTREEYKPMRGQSQQDSMEMGRTTRC